MDLQKLLSQALGGSAQNTHHTPANAQSAQPGVLDQLSNAIPGGLAGGAAAGGVMALLLGSKSTRKMAKKVVKYGGTAVLGGLAYKAYKNWDQNKVADVAQPVSDAEIIEASENIPQRVAGENSLPIGLVLVSAMVAATKADGNIDAEEHRKLFEAIEKLGLNNEEKATVFDLFAKEFTAQDIAALVENQEHKAEVYMAAYLAIEVDDARERNFLNELSVALGFPTGFAGYLEQQAKVGVDA